MLRLLPVFAALLVLTIGVCPPDASADGSPATQPATSQPKGAEEGSTGEPSHEKSGGWRLADEKSIYLREHIENPVEWYPWGEEAFARARDEGKMIFLSIGYSSCHWCHVMRRQSFTDPEVAAALADSYIAIKVDREELPHVDDAYMEAVQSMGQSGGWPLSVFLTSDRQPFYGGTYFRRDDFLQLVGEIASQWKQPERRQRMQDIASDVVGRLTEQHANRGNRPARAEFLNAGLERSFSRYDTIAGGFSRAPLYAPKFPSPRLLVLLTAYDQLYSEPKYRDAVEKTLGAMANGGLFDQVGGGFHRYTVDRKWAIPHFEKMLYSQGLLAESYLDVFRMTGNEDHAHIARRTLDALLRDFGLESGGFASAWDADSAEEEGTYYVWNPKTLESAVGPQLAPLLTRYLGVDVHGNFEHAQTVLHVATPIEKIAEDLFMEEKQVAELVATGLEKMRVAREKREAPKRDDKVILGWNALVISALAKGGMLLDEPRYIRAATAAHALCAKQLAGAPEPRRVYSDGETEFPATLRDLALHLRATLDLYGATLEMRHVAHAFEVLRIIERDYSPTAEDRKAGRGGFYEARKGDEVLVARKKEFVGDALPNGNAVLARAYLHLHGLTGDARYRSAAEGIVDEALTVLGRVPHGAPEMLLAVLELDSRVPEIAIAGDPNAADTQAMLDAVRRGSLPFRVWAFRPPGTPGEQAATRIPLLAKRPAGERATGYVCVNFVCRAPVHDPADFRTALDESWRPRFDGNTPPSSQPKGDSSGE